MMPPLNFASRPFRNEVLLALLFGLAAAALLGATVQHVLMLRRLLSGTTSALHKEVATLEQEMARLRQESADRRLSPPSKSQLAEWALVKDLVDRRLFSWTDLLSRLESVLPPGVRLVSITPSVKSGQVSLDLSAVVRDSDEGLGFVRALEDRKEFADVYPLSVNERTQGGAEFHYTMRYLPPARRARSRPASEAPTPEADPPGAGKGLP